jgi:membrane protein implicated in regulation of membrane protease activity
MVEVLLIFLLFLYLGIFLFLWRWVSNMDRGIVSLQKDMAALFEQATVLQRDINSVKAKVEAMIRDRPL